MLDFKRPPRGGLIEVKHRDRFEAYVTLRVDSKVIRPHMDELATIMSESLTRLEDRLRKEFPGFIIDGERPHLSQSCDNGDDAGILITSGCDFVRKR